MNNKNAVLAILVILLLAVPMQANANILTDIGGWFKETFTSNAPFMTVQGISVTDYQTADNRFPDGAYILTVRQGGMSQVATGTYRGEISANQITADGKTAEKNFALDVINVEQVADYPITTDTVAEPIIKYGAIKDCGFTCDDKELDECRADSASRDYVLLSNSFGGYTDYCIPYEPIAPSVGNLPALPDVTFKSKVKIQAGSTTIERDVTSKAEFVSKTEAPVSGFVDFGEIGYGQWNGNLVSGTATPDPRSLTTPVKAAYVGGKWRLISIASYNDYSSKAIEISAYISKTQTLQNLQIAISGHNARASTAISEKSFNTPYNQGALQEASSLDSAFVRLSLPTMFQYPTFTFYISASKVTGLGIKQMYPSGTITSIKAADITSGGYSYVELGVKNNGEAGTLKVSAQCSPAYQQGNDVEAYFEAGQSKTLQIPIGGSSDTVTDSNCQACVISPPDGKKTDCRDVQFKIIPNTIPCVDGSESCIDGHTIQVCDAGVPKLLVDCAATNQVCSLQSSSGGVSDWECVGGTPIIPPKNCDSAYSCCLQAKNAEISTVESLTNPVSTWITKSIKNPTSCFFLTSWKNMIIGLIAATGLAFFGFKLSKMIWVPIIVFIAVFALAVFSFWLGLLALILAVILVMGSFMGWF